MTGLGAAGGRDPWVTSFGQLACWELVQCSGAYPVDESAFWIPLDYWDADDIALEMSDFPHIWTDGSREDFSSVGGFDVHTLTCCTHIFLLHSLSAHIRTLSCVCTYTHGSRMAHVLEKVHCTCVAISLLMFHPSLLFLHGHFETTPDCDFTDDPVHTFLPYLPVLNAQDMRHSAHASRSLATWPNQMQTQVMSPRRSTSILPWMMTRRSSTIRTTTSPISRKPEREHHTIRCSTVFGFSEQLAEGSVVYVQVR